MNMKTAVLTACLLIFALASIACGKKGELEDPDKNKIVVFSQTLAAGN